LQSDGVGLSRDKAAHYRRMAAQCVARAQRTIDSAAKLQWLEMAQHWQALADAIEKPVGDKDPH
jgi:hypothetical protein